MTKVSTLIPSLLPNFYSEDGRDFIAFIKAYYEWLEQSSDVLASDLLDLRDIDSTVDEFLRYFRQTYISNVPAEIPGNQRTIIKKISDLYDAKGTPEAIKLLMRMLYNVEAEIYLPGDDVFMSSGGTWKVPTYLEVTISTRTRDFIGRQIIGASSGATAIVESVVRRRTNGAYYDVIYLSSVVGNFKYGELITDQSGSLVNAPTVKGSLNEIIILNGGSNNAVGDIFTVTSTSGKQALARVVETQDATGRVTFLLEDGGTGYSANAQTIVSEKLLVFAGSPSNANSSITNFTDFEVIEQPLYEVGFLSANNDFEIGDVVVAYTSGTWIEQANGLIVGVSQSGANGIITMFVDSGDVRFGDVIHKAGNTIAANIANTNNITAKGVVVGSNNTSVGVYNITNTFKIAANSTRVHGLTSNTYANIELFGSGTGAQFDIGSLTSAETIYVWNDFLQDRNIANVSLLDIRLDGYGSGLGVVTGVDINDGGSGYANDTIISFLGGGDAIDSVTINLGGTGYKNGEHIEWTGTGINTAISITTNTSGGITSVNVIDGGSRHLEVPTLTVNTTAGTGASLTAVLTNPTTAANATITTDGSGVITSITMEDSGEGYFTTPNLSVTGGTGANLSANMSFGYGFTKSPSEGINDIINSCLRTTAANVGTILSLANVAPGESYNHNPFVRVVEPLTVGLGRRDLILHTANVVGAFAPGEIIQQNVTSNIVTLTYTGISGNSAFDINELVSQNSNSATGIIYERDSTTLRLKDVTGTFAVTSNSMLQITGLTSNSVANVANVAVSTQTSVAKGTVLSSNSSSVTVRRRNINLVFDLQQPIIGEISQATANVVEVISSSNNMVMGNNAVISANVQVADGVASAISVMASGFGFTNGQLVTLQSNSNPTSITGLAILEREGTGEGFFTSTKGFTSEDQYLYDGDYYQKYSYDVRASLSLDRYADTLKSVLHVAGTKLYGSVRHTSTLQVVMDVSSRLIQFITNEGSSADFSSEDNSFYILLL